MCVCATVIGLTNVTSIFPYTYIDFMSHISMFHTQQLNRLKNFELELRKYKRNTNILIILAIDIDEWTKMS